MFKIFWLESAVDDLARLKAFLEKASPKAASIAAKLIKNATNKLQEFPLIGQDVEGLEDFYDIFIEFGASGYHLRYRVFNQKIYIIHIKHARELSFK
ncbi:MAG: plasmid stabilization protein [Rickettsiales bacterium]|nr:MAG: plasmid stabilization protein [Rickettsiales bacterium]